MSVAPTRPRIAELSSGGTPPAARGGGISRPLWLGASAGLLATIPMTGVMELCRRLLPGPQHPLVPRRVTEETLELLGLDRHVDEGDEPAWWWVTVASHLLYGAGVGLLYGLMHFSAERVLKSQQRRPRVARTVLPGAAFGLAVWAVSYLGLLPALGIIKPQGTRPLRQNTDLILSHLVWGATTAMLVHAFPPKGLHSK